MVDQGDVAVPETIRRYFAAHDRRDADAALSAFAADGRVFDDGREYRGLEEMHGWLARSSTQFTYTRTFLDASEEPSGAWLVRNRLEGNFPGGVVELGYRFQIRDDRVLDLVIQP